MILPAWFRRAAVFLLPFENVQRVRKAIDIMDQTSRNVIAVKKAALQAGDDKLAQQVGEGKQFIPDSVGLYLMVSLKAKIS